MGRRAGVRGGLAAVVVMLVAGCSPQGGGTAATGTRSVAPSTGAAVATASVVPTTGSPSTRAVSRSQIIHRTILTATPRPTSPATSATGIAPAVPVPRQSVALPAGVATEASGLAPAGGTADVFWTVDDGTGTDSLIAIDRRGLQVGSVQVEGMSAGNAEALSSAPCAAGAGARCLFIGDIGDHSGREDVTIYRVPEPAAPGGSQVAVGTAWSYTYADGARNAEAMFVAPDGSVVVIDKPQRSADGSVRAHHVYRGAAGGGVLALVGTFTPPAPTLPLQSMFEGNVVTDAALQVGADRTRVLVQFYDQVLQYTAPRPSADPAEFFRWPHTALQGPDLIQAEGISPLPDGCGFASISEAGPGGSVSRLSLAPCR